MWGPTGGKQGIKFGSNGKDSPECALLLLQAGADPNTRDWKGRNPLHTACQTAAADSIPILLDYGTELNAKDIQQGTPLHNCCFYANWGPIDAILTYLDTHPNFLPKWDTTSVQQNGYMPIESAIKNNQHAFLSLVIASESRFLKHGLDGMIITSSARFEKLLNRCLERGAYECLQLLLNKYTQSGCDDVNFTELIVKALTVYKSP